MDISTLVTSVVTFVFTVAGQKLVENVTDDLFRKVTDLRKKITNKLNLKPKAKAELDKGKDMNIEVVKSYLQTEMIEDEEFKQQIETLMEEIKKELEVEGKNVMNIFGGKGYQQNQNQGTINIANTINNINNNP